MEQKKDNNLDNQIKNAAKQITAAEVFESLNANQRWLISWISHTSLQKGRVMGQMEMDGKSAEDIAKRLHVPVKMVQTALNEKPEDVLVLMENGGEDIVIETDNELSGVESGDSKTESREIAES